MPEITQLTWLCLEEPTKADSIQDKSGTRLWFVTKAWDATGAMTLGIAEKKVLALTQADDKDVFEQKNAANALGFPLFTHARISRSIKSTAIGSSQTDGSSPTKAFSQAVGSSQTDGPSPDKAISLTMSRDTTMSPSSIQGYVSYVLEDFETATWTTKEALD